MKKIFIYFRSWTDKKFFILLLSFAFAMTGNSQVLIPFTGSTSVPCGSNVVVQAHNGSSGTYNNNANGFVVLNAGFAAVINISGTYTTEANFDYIRIYNGVGTGGTLLGTYHGQNLNLNYTGTAGQTLTIQFQTDGSVVYAGFNLNVTYSGNCFATPCSGTPGANAVVTPTYQVCSNVNVGMIGLSNSYTVGGLTYQWYSATQSNVGPFSPVASATNNIYTVPGLTTTTWYQTVITCTNSGLSYTTLGSPVTVAATTTSLVPYYESFELIGATNRLPNCSWWAPNQGTTVLTYTTSGSNNRVPRTGTSFGAFALPSTNNTMYTNGIWMEPGITYSAATHYATEYFGYTNWSNLSILVGPNQAPSGLQMVATVSPAVSGPYKELGGTFTVPSPGFYYVAIRANGSTGSALYLMIDDISVTIPCTPSSNNSPTLSLSASNTTICAGDQINLTANGASSYSWSNGASGSNIVVTPMVTTNYTVTGTNTLTNCSEKLSQNIVVNPAPDVFVVANKNEVCSGDQVVLTAYGASGYVWSNGGSGPVITISPTVTGVYSAVGLNSFGCSGTAAQQIVVKPLPNVSAMSTGASEVCAADMITLTGSGAVSYSWHSSNSSVLFSGQSVNVIPGTTTTYTVFGIGLNGCSNKGTVTQNVVTCVGINENAGLLNGLDVYPNPTNGRINVLTTTSVIHQVQIIDLTGRIVISVSGTGASAEVDLTPLSNGIYYAKINSQGTVQVVKIVKQ